MTDTTRDLLISLASHMAYMQAQLEAHNELDDPEDYYWYRESVLLRQKVTDVLADEPAAPAPPADGEVAEPTREELWELWLRLNNELPDRPAAVAEFWEHARVHTLALARAAELLQRQALVPVSVSERPWEREGWCNADGRCWWGRGESDDWFDAWTLATFQAVAESYQSSQHTHCLPAHALPLPEVSE